MMGWFADKYEKNTHPKMSIDTYCDLADKFGDDYATELLEDVQDGIYSEKQIRDTYLDTKNKTSIEKRKKIQPVVDLLEYMIRVGKISNEGGHKIFAVVLKEPDLTDRVMDILDLELSEQETIAKVERLL